jgi:aspartate ammonia-lyase
VNEETARNKLYRSPAVTTALSPLIGYHRAAELAREMKETGKDVFAANAKLKLIEKEKLEQLMQPDNMLKKGFTMDELRKVL